MLDGVTPWPAALAAGYRERGYWRGENLSDLLREWSRSYGDRIALVHADRRISYAGLDQQVDRMAAGFRRRGIAAGDRVVVQLPNVPEFVIVCFALFRMGAKPVFALLAHRANEIRHLCALSGAVGYVVQGAYRGFDYAALAADTMAESPALEQVFVVDGLAGAEGFVPLAEVDAQPEPLVSPDPSDVAFFLLSGGTTALPKLIPRTHDDYAYQTRIAAELVGLSAEDTYLAALPVEFNFAWGCPGVIGTLRAGGTVVLAADADPDDCFEAIERERVTFTSLVPTVAQLWLDAVEAAPFGSSSLRLIQIGGAPLQREIAERISPAFDCQLQQVFGMAEGMISFTRETDPAETVLSTQGRPISPGDEIRIVDEADADLPPGRTGELLVRGPYTLQGYYRAPEHNARAFTEDGYYRSGDLARLTPTGELVIEGRIKDVIIRGGNKISAAEVEGHLLNHPAVDRVAVVAIPDLFLGERICAYVRPVDEPPTLQTLRDALHDLGIADYKLPDRLEIVTDLPLTGLGKVDKKFLAKDAAAKADTLQKD
ncbi:AMP-binding protein [Streptomyces sp. NBC_00243]|uniref:(2,3-dihydroxybenzoyl)adenylate synthase n=1 Tax=Streptomyces sp. NBC_00243 TaxID=2975688 RepID=UPI002DDBF005|nr:AMP-binding protein [Streptomyces sp. NBC_00243]WRZ17320.1 AMP-binding protein [Streptomyces sp. NBC_00243]